MAGAHLEIIVLFVLILVNGVLALAEFATVSARQERLRRRARGPSRAAAQALELARNPERLLATVQVGITLVGVLSGAYAGVTVAEQLATRLAQVPALATHAEALSVGIVVAAITLLSLVVGELVPKRIALAAPEHWATVLAPAMVVLSRLASPLVWLLSGMSELVLRLLRVRSEGEVAVGDEEVDMLMEEGARLGVFTHQERELVSRALDLDDYQVRAVMTPRQRVASIREGAGPEDVLAVATTTSHAWLPVLSRDGERVLGIASVQRLLAQHVATGSMTPDSGLQKAVYMPETGSPLGLISAFRAGHSHMAVVVDEYGSFAGIVTMYDVLRGLIGDVAISGGPQSPPSIQARDDGSYLVDGLLPLLELRETMSLPADPERERESTTVSGLMMALLQRMPEAGDRCEWLGYEFEVLDMDRLRVDKVLMTPPRRP